MGFGICLFANILLLFEMYGSEVFAYALFGYGFACLMNSDNRFKSGAIFAGLAVIPSAVKALNTFSVIDTSQNWVFGFSIHFLISLFSCLMLFNLFITVKKIAIQGGDLKLSRKSDWAMRITATVLLLYTASQFLNSGLFVKDQVIIASVGVTIALKYVMLLFNLLFLYNCYAVITTPELLRKEKKEDSEYADKQKKKAEQKEKEREEELEFRNRTKKKK